MDFKSYRTVVIRLMLCMCIIACSCNIEPNEKTPDSVEMTLLPGECLKSTQIVLDRCEFDQNPGGLEMVFAIDEECEFETVKSYRNYCCYRYAPTDNIFKEFYNNASYVRESYDSFWRRFVGRKWLFSTIFYDSGISLVADKDFAGVKAGNNIALNNIDFGEWHRGQENPTVVLKLAPTTSLNFPADEGFQHNYCLYRRYLDMMFPADISELMDEDVSLTLSVPVKTVLLLTWFNDQLANPDAPLPVREDTLTCSFTIHKGLHRLP